MHILTALILLTFYWSQLVNCQWFSDDAFDDFGENFGRRSFGFGTAAFNPSRRRDTVWDDSNFITRNNNIGQPRNNQGFGRTSVFNPWLTRDDRWDDFDDDNFVFRNGNFGQFGGNSWMRRDNDFWDDDNAFLWNGGWGTNNWFPRQRQQQRIVQPQRTLQRAQPTFTRSSVTNSRAAPVTNLQVPSTASTVQTRTAPGTNLQQTPAGTTVTLQQPRPTVQTTATQQRLTPSNTFQLSQPLTSGFQQNGQAFGNGQFINSAPLQTQIGFQGLNQFNANPWGNGWGFPNAQQNFWGFPRQNQWGNLASQMWLADRLDFDVPDFGFDFWK